MANKLLKDYYEVISGDLSFEQYYKDSEKSIKELSRSHRDYIKLLNELKINEKLVIQNELEEIVALESNTDIAKKDNKIFQKIYAIYMAI